MESAPVTTTGSDPATESAPMIDSAPAIGIDLGTTYSCVGVFRHGKVEIIANEYGKKTTPSYVAFKDEERFIGETAKLQADTNPSNTVFDVKRMIGRRFQDESVQSNMEHWPFEVVEEEGKPRIRVEYKGESKTFHPEEISAMVLAKMKQVAEDYLGMTVTKAVVTVPAYFSDSQRRATKDAATIAGLDVLRIINEPTCAAVAYGLDRMYGRTWSEKRLLVVFDLGGGKCDVSVLTIEKGLFKVVTTAGANLGGEDFDNRMVDHFVQEFEREHNKDLRACKWALRRLRTAWEIAKKALTYNTQANIDISCLFEGIDFYSTINRALFEDLNADLFRNTLELVQQALSEAEIEKAAVDDIVLVGCSTRIPRIQQLLRDFFDGKQLSKDINPDEAVACGAAMEAAILNGDQFDHVREFKLQDVTPLFLGVPHNGEIMTVVIKRNTAIPAKQTLRYVHDNAKCVKIMVYEWQRALTNDNNPLGQFTLNRIQVAPQCKIDVTFDIDFDGILTVSAVDQSTEVSHQLTITNDDGRLSGEEIRRMMRDAEKFEEDDEKQKCRVTAMTALESCAWNFRSAVERDTVKAKISESYCKKVQDKVNDTLEWLDRNQQGEIDEFEDMQRELTRIRELGETYDFEDKQKELGIIDEPISA